MEVYCPQCSVSCELYRAHQRSSSDFLEESPPDSSRGILKNNETRNQLSTQQPVTARLKRHRNLTHSSTTPISLCKRDHLTSRFTLQPRSIGGGGSSKWLAESSCMDAGRHAVEEFSTPTHTSTSREDGVRVSATVRRASSPWRKLGVGAIEVDFMGSLPFPLSSHSLLQEHSKAP